MGKEEQQEIVIIGGGICGLATALGLHRKGIRSLVLEKSGFLNSSGAALCVHINGWRALDQLGVGDQLRAKAAPILEYCGVKHGEKKTVVTPIRYGDLRCLRRSDLIKALANDLPDGSIRFGYSIVAIEEDPVSGFPIIHSADGYIIKAKVLIGCDGTNSVTARLLGLESPKPLSMMISTRGFTLYPDGHNYGNQFVNLTVDNFVLGRLPVDEKMVHWFIRSKNSSEESELPKDPHIIRARALETVKHLPEETVEMVKQCDLCSLSLAHIRYRAPWHLLFASLSRGTITVAGDAMHVMTPFLGQGGSSALEDAVVLARCLAKAATDAGVAADGDANGQLRERVGRALEDYVRERRPRVLRLCVQSFLFSEVVTATSMVRKLLCLSLMLVFFGGMFSGHKEYDCGKL